MGAVPTTVVPVRDLVSVAKGACAHSAVAPPLVVGCGVRGPSEDGTVVRVGSVLTVEGAGHLVVVFLVQPMLHGVGFTSVAVDVLVVVFPAPAFPEKMFFSHRGSIGVEGG